MNKKDLDILLNKYYRGETTLDEEQQLRNALSDDSVDALLMHEIESVDSEIEVPADLESNLSDMIDQWQDDEQQEAKVTPSLWRRASWWAAAACVALIATVGIWYLRSNKKAQVMDDNAPMIAETSGVSTSPIIEETPNDDINSEQQSEVQPMPQPQTDANPKPKIQAKPASAFKNKVEHLAQTQAKPQVQPQASQSDEEIAIAALEKFSTVLNKGMDQLNDAGEKIDNINNTIQQHLI